MTSSAFALGLFCSALLGLARDGDSAPEALAPYPVDQDVCLHCGQPQASETAGTAQLSVRMTNLRNTRGRVAVALFDTDKDFPDQKQALRGKLARIDGSTAYVRFDGLKAGTYAVAVLHDENSNDKMDFNLVGMPLEGFGFSNDAAVWLGPPSFDAAAFRLRASGGQIKLKVRYFEL